MNDFMNLMRRITPRDRKTLLQRAAKLGEEAGEVLAEVLVLDGAHGTEYKNVYDSSTEIEAKIAEECVDVIIVASSILAQLETLDEEIERLVSVKVQKWKGALKFGDEVGN